MSTFILCLLCLKVFLTSIKDVNGLGPCIFGPNVGSGSLVRKSVSLISGSPTMFIPKFSSPKYVYSESC